MTAMQAFLDGPVPTRAGRWPLLSIAGVGATFVATLIAGAACVLLIENHRLSLRMGIALFTFLVSCFLAALLVVADLRVRANEERYRTILENSSDGIFIADSHGRLTFVNDRFAEMLARKPEDLIGHDGPSFLADSDRELVNDSMRSRRSGVLRRAQRELRFTRPNGREIAVLATTTTLYSASRRFSGVIGTITDITSRVAAENEMRRVYEENAAAHRALQRAHDTLRAGVSAAGGADTIEDLAERLAKANQELETFTYSVSHDLRAPLRAIGGFTNELLLDYKSALDERGQHYLERIVHATERMTALIDDLLTLSRTSREALQRRTVDVGACARVVANEILDRHRERAIDIVIEPDLHAQADPRLLRIVFENLLGNAVKFSATRERAEIRIHRVVRDGRSLFAITDNGVGFNPEFASKLFTPFHRLHRASEFEGNGIGLAIVHRIVHRHGGIILAEAVPGEGATFAFSLGSA